MGRQKACRSPTILGRQEPRVVSTEVWRFMRVPLVADHSETNQLLQAGRGQSPWIGLNRLPIQKASAPHLQTEERPQNITVILDPALVFRIEPTNSRIVQESPPLVVKQKLFEHPAEAFGTS